MHKHIIIFLLGLFSCVHASDEINFDVLLFGKKVGYLKLTRAIKGDTVNYLMQGHSKAKILWMEYDDVSHYEAKYKGDKILYCKYREDMNGKLKHFTELVFNGKDYAATTKSGTRNFQPEHIPSLLWMYYNEPVGVKKIFMEAQLFHTPLTQKNPGHYMFKNNEGHSNEYIYKNGELNELIFETPLATVRMKRAE